MNALAFAIQVLTSLPSLIAAGIDVVGLLEQTNTSLKAMQDEDRDPTDAEWDALNDLIEDLRSQRPNVSGE